MKDDCDCITAKIVIVYMIICLYTPSTLTFFFVPKLD